MFGGGGGGHMDYSNAQNSYMGPSPPSMNGMSGHHSGGYCSQMQVNQNNQCPPNSKLQTCSGCSTPILERYLLYALERYWHHFCLKCTACGANLADIGTSCFTREGMILCRNDYQKMYGGGNGGVCNGCGIPIPSNELVMRAGVSHPGSNHPFVFHIKCFICSKCSHPLTPGDRYSVLNGALYCESDALKIMKNGIGSPSNAHVATSNGPTAPPKKGKVGRPRRSRD